MDTKEGLNAIFQHATEGILIADENGTIIRVNPAGNKMFGYSEGELESQKVEVLIPRKIAKKHVADRTSFHNNPHPRSMGSGMNLAGKRKDESEFPVEVSLSPYQFKKKTFIIAFIVDITVRKRIEDDLRIKTLELEERVKERTLVLEEAVSELEKTKLELSKALKKEKELNELKSRFVSMASHEFRTPLAAILSSLQLIIQYGELNDKDKQLKHIDRSKKAVRHLTDIIEDMLSVSKLEEGKTSVVPESFDIDELLNGIVVDVKTGIKSNQGIIYAHGGEKGVFHDKKILRHIVTNLLSNAIKFSPGEKAVELSTEVRESLLIITVKDYGIGISDADQRHLFERFFRGTNASNIQGTGLGLNIVAKYVELLKGKINFESELKKGTTFIIILPSELDIT